MLHDSVVAVLHAFLRKRKHSSNLIFGTLTKLFSIPFHISMLRWSFKTDWTLVSVAHAADRGDGGNRTLGCFAGSRHEREAGPNCSNHLPF